LNSINTALSKINNKLPNIEILRDEPMKNHTSFRIGGCVQAVISPKNTQELISLYQILQEYGIKPLIIGNGTNLLVDDCSLDLIVIKTMRLNEITKLGDDKLIAGSGTLLSKLAVFACENDMAGLEFAHGIPGTLGGAITMNAGAYGGEMKDVIRETTAYCPEKGIFTIKDAEHEFSYRISCFSKPESNSVIISSEIKLDKGSKEEIKSLMGELSKKRRESQPVDVPSAGSAFKRPKNGYAAALIEQAGLKGYTVGDAQVSEKHSGFIVNRGEAKFSDVMAVMEHVRETVFSQFGVELESEIKIIGGGI
jgi:UDP-N-acetylmuramate dehydrogenase